MKLQKMTTVAEIVDATCSLSLDEQHALVEILEGSVREENRKRLRAQADQVRGEYAAGEAWVATPEEIVETALRDEEDDD
jgi:hypothetical protein